MRFSGIWIILKKKKMERKFRTEDGHLILMTPEERDLFILDLTARIKYGVICLINRVDDFGEPWRNEKLTGFCYTGDGLFEFDFDGLDVNFAEKVKPYLRPMSSMTEEEKIEWKQFVDSPNGKSIRRTPYCIKYMDWLTEHMFDYRGLIEKGLALEAHEGMYNF